MPNGCPQIVDSITFEKVQKRILENKNASGRNNAKHRYIFSGFVVCGYCGKRMCGNRRYSGRNKSLYATYRCFTNKESCINKEINRYYLEDFVLAEIKKIYFYRDNVKKMYRKINRYIESNTQGLRDDIKHLSAELATINESSQNVTNAIEQGVSADDIFKRSDELQEKKIQLQSEIAKKSRIIQTAFDSSDIDKTVTDCRALLKNPVNPENRDFLERVIDKIIVKRDDVKIIFKTCLSVNDDFDTIICATRDEIYKFGKEDDNA